MVGTPIGINGASPEAATGRPQPWICRRPHVGQRLARRSRSRILKSPRISSNGKLCTRTRVSLLFVDFEASSLSSRAYPIEVGYAWITDDHVVHVADLIRPDPTWPRDWSSESAAVPGIRRRELAQAEPAMSVARRYAALLTGTTIISDAPEFDAHWLGRLLELLPLPPSDRLFDFDHLAHVTMSHEAQRAVYEHLAGAPSPHRAGDDAARLAAAWLAGLGAG